MSFTLLGTGAATGVPVIACDCPVCLSEDPRNRRLRCAALVEYQDRVLLIDAGPDLREQALLHSIHHVDGLLLTHTHYDHIAGVDELRIFYYRTGEPLPCLLSDESFADMRHRYHYMFRPKMHGESVPAQFSFELLPEDSGTTTFQGIPLGYFSYQQGSMKVNGYRFGDLAYVSDVGSYGESIFESLQGVKTLVLSALRYDPARTHLTVDEAVAFADRVGAKQTWLTHVGHEVDHEAANAYLPAHVRMGYDGLKLPFEIRH